MADFLPADAAGVVVYVDAHGKHAAARVYIRGTRVRPGARTSAGDVELEFVPVVDDRSLGTAGRAAANEMELVVHDIPRQRVVLARPERTKLEVDR